MRTSPVDPAVMVLRLDRTDGSPLAIVVNYACHPVVLGPGNLLYSADYRGEMMRVVETSLEGNPLCMFVQGAAGDINPYYDKTSPAENAVALMNETGQTLAKEVLRVSRTIETKALPDVPIQFSRETLSFRGRWRKEKVMGAVQGTPLSDAMQRRIERMFRPSYQVPLTVLLFGREFAFGGVPAEIFVDYQIEIRERIKDLPVLFGGYTDGSVGYIPTIKAAVDGGYGASEAGTVLELGAGDRLVDAAVIRLGYFTGKLEAAPDSGR